MPSARLLIVVMTAALGLLSANQALAAPPELRTDLGVAPSALQRVDRKLTSYRLPVDGLVTACRAADKLSGQPRQYAKLGIARAAKALEDRLKGTEDLLTEALDALRRLPAYKSRLTPTEDRILTEAKSRLGGSLQEFYRARVALGDSLKASERLDCKGSYGAASQVKKADMHLDKARDDRTRGESAAAAL
jgi:hypothetical protein